MKSTYLKVKDSEFVKDISTSALLMTGQNSIRENEARRLLSKKISNKNDEINSLRNQVHNLTFEMSEVKTLLKKLLNESKE